MIGERDLCWYALYTVQIILVVLAIMVPLTWNAVAWAAGFTEASMICDFQASFPIAVQLTYEIFAIVVYFKVSDMGKRDPNLVNLRHLIMVTLAYFILTTTPPIIVFTGLQTTYCPSILTRVSVLHWMTIGCHSLACMVFTCFLACRWKTWSFRWMWLTINRTLKYCHNKTLRLPKIIRPADLSQLMRCRDLFRAVLKKKVREADLLNYINHIRLGNRGRNLRGGSVFKMDPFISELYLANFTEFCTKETHNRPKPSALEKLGLEEDIELKYIDIQFSRAPNYCTLCDECFNIGSLVVKTPCCMSFIHLSCMRPRLLFSTLCPYCKSCLQSRIITMLNHPRATFASPGRQTNEVSLK